MDAQVKETLAAGGIDVDGMLERCMGSEAIMGKLLKKFPADTTYVALERAFEAQDAQAALEASHTLKGVCGNLSMTALYGLFSRQTEALRRGDAAAAGTLMEQIAPAYEAMCRAIGGQGDGAR